jgi:hypothetical protein
MTDPTLERFYDLLKIAIPAALTIGAVTSYFMRRINKKEMAKREKEALILEELANKFEMSPYDCQCTIEAFITCQVKGYDLVKKVGQAYLEMSKK